MLYTGYRKGQARQDQLFENELKSPERNRAVVSRAYMEAREKLIYGQKASIEGYEIIR